MFLVQILQVIGTVFITVGLLLFIKMNCFAGKAILPGKPLSDKQPMEKNVREFEPYESLFPTVINSKLITINY